MGTQCSGMNAWRLHCLAATVFLSVAGSMPRVLADEITSARLAVNGTPDSDRIEVEVLIEPSTRSVALEITAFRIEEKPTHVETAIQGTGGDVDNEGNFKAISVLKKDGEVVPRPEDSPPEVDGYGMIVRRTIAVPVQNLKLDKSLKLTVGYLLTLVVDGKSVQAWPLPLFNLTPSDGQPHNVTYTVNVPMTTQSETVEDALSWQDGAYQETRVSRHVVSANVSSETRVRSVTAEQLSTRATESEVVALNSCKFKSDRERTIYFATNRQPVVPKNGLQFSSEMIDSGVTLNYGSCVVSVPIHHTRGKLELPGSRFVFWTERQDSSRHFIIESSAKFASITEFGQQLGKDDVLLFIHGYNNSFDDAIFRSAQLQYDLEFGGKSVAFSWPSQGRMALSLSDPWDASQRLVQLAYKQDELTAQKSVPHLMVLLKELLERKASSGGKLHVIAHSMGNRVLLQALHGLEHSSPEALQAQFDTVILAAADVDVVDFRLCREALMKSTKRVSYYFSSTDGALALSEAVHKVRPTGLVPIFDRPTLDALSAQGLTSIFNELGHVYAMQSQKLLTDIRYTLTGREPNKRPPSKTLVFDPGSREHYYWAFR